MRNPIFPLSLAKLAFCVTLSLAFGANTPLTADTIYKITSDRKEVVCNGVEEVIVMVEGDKSLTYLYLLGRIISEAHCIKGEGESFRVVRSSPEQRRRIVERWKSLGYTAEVTDTSGSETTVHNLYIDFLPPEGYASFTPGETTSIPLKRGEMETEVEFSQILRISIQGTNVVITLINGKEVSGKVEREHPGIGRPYRVLFSGIEDFGTDLPCKFSLEFDKAKSLVFKSVQK